MGCDIHSCLEVLVLSDDAAEKDQWVSISKWEEHDDGDGGRYVVVADDDAPLSDRNYSLFAMLADVRNGYGFAADTGDRVTPIAAPKGVPADCSVEYWRWVEQWSGDGHSHSYFTLQELLDYDLSQIITQRGWVTAAEFYRAARRWGSKKGVPESWCGGVSGGSVRHVSNDEMIRLLELHAPSVMVASLAMRPPSALEDIYTQLEWILPYYEVAGELTQRAIPLMLAEVIKREISYEDIRVCFFFDN